MKSYLVIQTAFIGDAVLTLPLVQVLKKADADASVDVLVIPRTSELFSNHPAIHHVHIIDKRGKDSGLAGLRRFAHLIAEGKYDVALIPHRSIRSALLPWLGRIHSRIGFDRSAGWFLMTQTVRYDPSVHEVERNLSLLRPLGIQWTGKELPSLFPTATDVQKVDDVSRGLGIVEFFSLDRNCSRFSVANEAMAEGALCGNHEDSQSGRLFFSSDRRERG